MKDREGIEGEHYYMIYIQSNRRLINRRWRFGVKYINNVIVAKPRRSSSRDKDIYRYI